MLKWEDIEGLHGAIYTKDPTEVGQVLELIDAELEISSRLNSDRDDVWNELDLLASCLVIGYIRIGHFNRAARVPVYVLDKEVLPTYEPWRLRLVRRLLATLAGALAAADV